jgi:hypothetical protein
MNMGQKYRISLQTLMAYTLTFKHRAKCCGDARLLIPCPMSLFTHHVDASVRDAVTGWKDIAIPLDVALPDTHPALHQAVRFELPGRHMPLPTNLRNLDLSNGHCNSTRLPLHCLGRNVLTCTILGSTHHGNMVDLPRIPMACGGGIIEGLEFQPRQFSVRLAFALTMNKAQG